ncbi:MAG: AbrB/MazE/SpoVT family DNA-binding domain-containing protein [Oscillospiraceae bacterium]|nr:AbrB/MazE/SpoVT family DNA-binding domain-containing protein [Oscillospiraceae bacterium]
MLTAQLLEDDEGQFVILPEEYRFEGDAVRIKMLGSLVLLAPLEFSIGVWADFWASLDE